MPPQGRQAYCPTVGAGVDLIVVIVFFSVVVAVVIVDIGNAGLVVIDVLYFHLRDAKHIVQLSVLVLMFLDIAIYTGLYESDISSVRFAITN